MPNEKAATTRKTVINKRGQKVIVSKKANGTVVRENMVTGVVTKKRAGQVIEKLVPIKGGKSIGPGKNTPRPGIYNKPGSKTGSTMGSYAGSAKVPNRSKTMGGGRKIEPVSPKPKPGYGIMPVPPKTGDRKTIMPVPKPGSGRKTGQPVPPKKVR